MTVPPSPPATPKAPSGFATAVAILVTVAVLATIDLASSHSPPKPAAPPIPRLASQPLRGPAGDGGRLEATTVPARGDGLYLVAPGARGVRVSQLAASAAGRLRARAPVTVPLPAGLGEAAVSDVGVWRGRPALFTVDGTSVRVIALSRGGRQLASGRSTALRSLPSGSRRDVRFVLWSGPLPDLMVIDRTAKGRTTVRVLSGESRFRKPVARIRVADRRFPPSGWTVDAGTVSGTVPDLVFVTHDRDTGTGRTEVHVLEGESRFRRYILQRPTSLPDRPGPGYRFRLGRLRGVPVLMAAKRSPRGRLRLTAILF